MDDQSQTNEQVRILYAGLPNALIINAFLALILVVVQVAVIEPVTLFGWLALLLTTLLARAVLLAAWRRGGLNAGQRGPHWMRLFRASVIATGLVWGAGAVLLFPVGDISHQVFLAFVLAGLCAGAASSLAVDPVSTIGFQTSALVPLMASFLLEGAEMPIAMGNMTALFLLFVAANSLRAGRSIRENIQLRFEAGIREKLLSQSENRLKQAQQVAHLGSFDWDIVSKKLQWSDEHFRLWGMEPQTVAPSPELFRQSLHPDDAARTMEVIQRALRGGRVYDHVYRVVWPDRSEHYIRGLGEVSFDQAGQAVRLIGTVQDMTEQKRVEAELRIAATTFESQEGMMITDAGNMILRVNPTFTKMTGYAAEEIIGETPRILKSGHHDASFYAGMWTSIRDTGTWGGEVWNRRKNGEIYPDHLTITAVKDPNGVVTNYVGTFTDMAMSRDATDEIKHLAFYDLLTRLPNRRLLLDRLKQVLASSARNGLPGALLFIDLDNFKTLNDTLGYVTGDLLLQQVAQRLESNVREGDTVARIGGDEFVVVLKDLSEEVLEAAAQTEATGDKLLAILNRPYRLGVHEYRGAASIGAALFRGHDQSQEELLKQADIAMYQAKKEGRNAMRFFDPQMQDSINTRAALEKELHKALDNRQFHLYYQIQVDESRRPLGAEALIRWKHPERGWVSPAQFIPLSEETGLILPIGQWVLETACAQIKAWQQDALTRGLILSVNISARQIRQAGFVDHVRATVQRHAIDPRLLEMELTESMLVDDIEGIIVTMNQLKEIGIQFSLDDFGTGYSCLQYLKRLPLDQLKIDQSFVRELSTSRHDRSIVRTIIAMARGLDLDVIAEGVETEEQRELLLKKGCTHYQGFLFGRAIPIEQFDALLRQKVP